MASFNATASNTTTTHAEPSNTSQPKPQPSNNGQYIPIIVPCVVIGLGIIALYFLHMRRRKLWKLKRERDERRRMSRLDSAEKGCESGIVVGVVKGAEDKEMQ